MTHESRARTNPAAGAATAVGEGMNRGLRRAARATLTALWKASEAACEAALRRHVHLIESLTEERRTHPVHGRGSVSGDRGPLPVRGLP